MTAFAISFARDRVVVASDTLGYAPDRHEAKPLGFVSKIIPLPHIHAVLFGRGQMSIIYQAAVELMRAPNLFDVEDAALALPAALRTITAAYADDNDIEEWGTVGLAEVALAGWSDRGRRMRFFEFFNLKGYALEQDTAADLKGSVFTTTPRLPPDRTPAVAGMNIDQALVALMRAERDFFADNSDLMGGAVIGGEIVAWQLDRDAAISHRTLYRFPDYVQTKTAAAAVFSRLARGDIEINLNEALVPADEALDTAVAPPEPPANVVAVAPGATRAERRRAEKLARQGARRVA